MVDYPATNRLEVLVRVHGSPGAPPETTALIVDLAPADVYRPEERRRLAVQVLAAVRHKLGALGLETKGKNE